MRKILVLLVFCFYSQYAFTQSDGDIETRGIYSGFSFGTWHPDRSSNVLKWPLMLGFCFELKLPTRSFGFTFDLIAGFKTDQYTIQYADSLLTRSSFGGAQITLDYAQQLWHKDRVIIDAIGGAGYGQLSYYNPNAETNISKSSIVFNPGIGLKYLIRSKRYMQWKLQYNLADYHLNNPIGTDHRGNFVMLKVIVGSR